MNKFKVGDEVQIIKDNFTGGWFDLTTQYIIGVVMQVNDDEWDKYYVAVKGYEGIYKDGWFAFNDEHLMLVSENDKAVSNQDDILKRTLMNSGDGGVVVGVEHENELQDESVDQFFESDIILPKTDEDDFTCCLGKGIESDGGSSSYYFTKLPKHLIDQIVETGGIEIKDIIRYVFDNDADAFNIVKAQKRIIEALKGKGKAGITPLYDAKKITFFANEQYEAMKNKESK